jgi:hypothetical protein
VKRSNLRRDLLAASALAWAYWPGLVSAGCSPAVHRDIVSVRAPGLLARPWRLVVALGPWLPPVGVEEYWPLVVTLTAGLLLNLGGLGGAGRGWATTRLVLGNLVSDLGPCVMENLTSLQVNKTFLPPSHSPGASLPWFSSWGPAGHCSEYLFLSTVYCTPSSGQFSHLGPSPVLCTATW